MITNVTYCLLPADLDLTPILAGLFQFDGVVLHDGEVDHPVTSATEAARLFAVVMRPGDGVRFHSCTVSATEGGWLYKIDGDRAVVGVSGDAKIAAEAFRAALLGMVPQGVICYWGEQPPPESVSDFVAASKHPYI